MQNQNRIETEDLTKIYGNGTEVRALDGVSIKIEQGEFIAVMGPSGSGKSTLLNMLGALDKPTSGRVLIDGYDISQIKDLDRFRAQTVGFVFQMHNLIPTLNAIENVEVPMQGQIRSRRKRNLRALEMLRLVSLDDRSEHLPSQLSGGERQRIAIARALANEPSVILADEPTGNLDSQSGEEVMQSLRKLNGEFNTTIIVVTHDMAVARETDRILVMQDGKITDDHQVGQPFEEDIKSFWQSGLGQAVLAGNTDAIDFINSSDLPIKYNRDQ